MDYLKEIEIAVAVLDECVQDLVQDLPLPICEPVLGHFRFRHEKKTLDLLWCMKAVRIASANNAALALLRAGYTQEVYALCRMIDETCEDINYMAAALGQDGQPDKLQLKFMAEFFQEEFSDPSDPLSTTERDRVPRKKVRAGVTRVGTGASDPSKHIEVTRTLYHVFSGFVHGAYVHIMDLFIGRPPRFHTKGMLGTPRMDECLRNHTSYVSRSLMAAELVALLKADSKTQKKLFECLMAFARATGSLSVESIEKSEGLRRPAE